MITIRLMLCAALVALSAPAPAAAPAAEKTPPARAAPDPAATELPEGGSWGLFLLGVSGVLIGRQMSRKRKPKAA